MKKFIALLTKEKNGCKKDDFDFLLALYSVFKELVQFFFHKLLANFFKQRYTVSVTSNKYLSKLISQK